MRFDLISSWKWKAIIPFSPWAISLGIGFAMIVVLIFAAFGGLK